MKKYAESKGFFDFKAERELYSIVKAWWECSSQRRERILLPENCKNRKSIQKKNRQLFWITILGSFLESDLVSHYFWYFFLYSDGESPLCFLKIRLKYSGFSYPIAREISDILKEVFSNKFFALEIRKNKRYWVGVVPVYCLKLWINQLILKLWECAYSSMFIGEL